MTNWEILFWITWAVLLIHFLLNFFIARERLKTIESLTEENKKFSRDYRAILEDVRQLRVNKSNSELRISRLLKTLDIIKVKADGIKSVCGEDSGEGL